MWVTFCSSEMSFRFDINLTSVVFRLFPLRERGLNPYAQTLTDEEIEVTAITLH